MCLAQRTASCTRLRHQATRWEAVSHLRQGELMISPLLLGREGLAAYRARHPCENVLLSMLDLRRPNVPAPINCT